MISCRKLLAELSNLLDDDVEAGLRQELELHLKMCPDCWVKYDTTRHVLTVFRGNDPYPLPTDVKHRLSEAVRRRLSERAR